MSAAGDFHARAPQGLAPGGSSGAAIHGTAVSPGSGRHRGTRGALLAALLAGSTALPLSAPAPAEEAARLAVAGITPAGEDVEPGRQIVIRFDRPVVALGDMSRATESVPVRITPPLDCEWRWIDRAALACQLGRDAALEIGTRYRLRLEPGIRSLDGATLTAAVEHEFVTRRPRVRWVNVYEWRGPGFPILRVTFDQPVTRDSVREHLFFAPAPEPAPSGTPAAAPPATSAGAREGRVGAQVAGLQPSGIAVLRGSATPEEAAEAARLGLEPARSWLVAPASPLPGDAAMQLAVEPGIEGAGPEPGVEDRVALAFHTVPELEFLGVRCTSASPPYGTVEILRAEAADPGRAARGCDPLAGTSLLFSAPVSPTEIKAHVRISPPLAAADEDKDPWANAAGHHTLSFQHRAGQTYPVRLPVALQAVRAYSLESAPGALRDVFERPLTEGIDFEFHTTHRRPWMHLVHPYAVLEQGVDSEVPLYVTNLDEVHADYVRQRSGERTPGLAHRIELPPVEDVSFAVPLGVRTLLEGRSGAVSGRLRARPGDAGLGSPEFFAQVTPFHVTLKLGHFSSVAWVADLATGEPVPGARVTIYPDTYPALRGLTASGHGPYVTDERGIAALPGTDRLDPDLRLLTPSRRDDPRLFLKVERGDDLALMPVDHGYRVYTRGAWPRWRARLGHLQAWGTTAQGVYRAGETIRYKLFVRHQDTDTLTPAPREGYALRVIDPKGQPLVESRLFDLSAFGTASGEVAVPANAPSGWYRFVVERPSDSRKRRLEAFRVLVSDFTPSPFKVRARLDGDGFEPGDPVAVDAEATLHAGGPYTQADVQVTARVRARALHPENPLASRFYFQTDTGHGHTVTVYTHSAPLDAQGRRTERFTLEDTGVVYGRLEVEAAVRDERGKSVANRTSAAYAGRDRYVGLRSERWLHRQGEPARVEFLVVDASGVPAGGQAVRIAIEREEVFGARVKGAGNAYVTHYERRWVEESACELRATGAAGQCDFTPARAGQYRAVATIADTRGRAHSTELSMWVVGEGRVVWADDADAALPIVAEKARYQVGETARFLVRNPFPGAQALVSVERYGVLRSWVQRLESSTPVIELEVQPDDLPGFYLAVEVLSPRVAAPPPERGQVDLGKPAARRGYVRVPVDDPYKRIDIAVTPGAKRYEPRQTARVDIQARPRNGPLEPVELAVAVLDESVFELIADGKRRFDPYTGLYGLDSLDVTTYSLLTRLVGRQKFEQKGADAGGDGGGRGALRDRFEFVAYWNPAIVTDAEGRASVSFELPDNLTGWRVLVLGASASDRLGLGDGRFEVNKETELRPVMPNQLTEGDRFKAGFSVLNRTDRTREIAVEMQASGPLAPAPAPRRDTILSLAPFARATVWMDLQTEGHGPLRLEASAADEADTDRTVHVVEVAPRRSLESAAVYGSLAGSGRDGADAGGASRAEEPVEVPGAIFPDVGEIGVTLSPSVIANLDGAYEYMRRYPYVCWEQRLTKAVMADSYTRLRPYLAAHVEWPGSADLPQRTLDAAAAFQAPNGGMTYWQPEDRRASPYLSAYTALGFGWLRDSGHVVPERVETRLHAYLQRLLRRDEFPDYYTRGMASTVRAVALAALARAGAVTAADLRRYADHLPRMSLFGKSHFLAAADRLGDGALAERALDAVLGHAEETGGKLQFVEDLDDGYGQILSSAERTQCAALSSLLAAGRAPERAARLEPLATKLARAVTLSRGRRSHWATTQDNVFCGQALVEYARVYERERPDAVVVAALGEDRLGEARFKGFRDPGVDLSRSLRADDRGRTLALRLDKQGPGRIYYQARLRYAPLEDAAARINAGMDLRREYSVRRDGRWTVLRSPMAVHRGELVRVDLYLSVPSPRHFVVVDDPVPGGLEPVNRALATASAFDADTAAFEPAGGSWWFERGEWRGFGRSFWSFYHRELDHDAARFFSDYLPAGDYHLSYAAQAIAVGEFSVLPAHGEEMYAPDVFGKGLPATLRVTEAP